MRSPSTPAGWSAATGEPPERLAVVSRLVTDGSVLLVAPEAAARGFYLRRGWREAGTARQQWGEHTVDAVLMVLAGAAD